jgi:DNA-binding transcriptional regulator/RsmH inhibitor MraZ
MAFLGESFIKIDDKGRLRIPTALKEGMSEEAQNKFVVSLLEYPRLAVRIPTQYVRYRCISKLLSGVTDPDSP